ncbi:hypothetical protein LG293_15970 (plasmid) [Citricoccus nitrophenolicus]
MTELTIDALASGEPIRANQVQKDDLLRLIVLDRADLRTHVQIIESVAHEQNDRTGEWYDGRGNQLTHTGKDGAATLLIRRSPLTVLPDEARSTIFYVRLRDETASGFEQLTRDNNGWWHGVSADGDYQPVDPTEIGSFRRNLHDSDSARVIVGDLPTS